MRRLLFLYAVVELAAAIALGVTIGWGWTVLALVAGFVLGVVVWAPTAGWQLSVGLVQLRSGLKEPRSALTDGVMVTLASVLVLVPGLVTTVLGLLLLAPPVRHLARPGLAALGMRAFERRIPLITDTTRVPGQHDYIDGEVIEGEVVQVSDEVKDDVRDVRPPALPQSRD